MMIDMTDEKDREGAIEKEVRAPIDHVGLTRIHAKAGMTMFG